VVTPKLDRTTEESLAVPPLRLPADARVVVAMSGGVDSSVVAWLLAEQGHAAAGLFMRNGVEVDEAEAAKKACCSLGDARDARMIAARLGIPFQSVDLAPEFSSIIEYFVSEYTRGRTPNPCAVCNRDLKFDALLRFSEELGAGYVATGTVVLGPREECASAGLVTDDLNLIGIDPPADGSFRCEVQIRYHHEAAPATVTLDTAAGRAEVRFDEPQHAVAPGQGAAFYHGERLIGGGWIGAARARA